MDGGRRLELYIHIPFCVRKCHYCDFLSSAADASVRGRYVEALLTELKMRATEYDKYSVATVFIGGGTPSVLTGGQLEQLMRTVREYYRLEENAEVTVELNPGTVDEEKLACCACGGVNRLSIGLQTADNEELARIGRIHTWEQFLETWSMVRAAGFGNVNVDLMSTLPGQTTQSYLATLKKVLALPMPPEHISAYSLIVEEGTPLAGWVQSGRLTLPDEEADREMYHLTKSVLSQSGYGRYEISNYAVRGYECRHNCGYWRRADYVGFGLGASSLINNVRFKNGDDLSRYLASPTGCREQFQTLSKGEQMEEFMFLGLRLTEGISAGEFAACFGSTVEEVYGRVIDGNIADGLLSWDERGERLFLTEKGLDLSNYVMAQFLL